MLNWNSILQVRNIGSTQMKGKHQKEKIKLFLCADHIIFAENPNEYNKIAPRTKKCIQQCCRTQGQHTKFNHEFYAITLHNWKLNISKRALIIPLTRIRYLGIQ